MKKQKVIVSWSGGKDSALALYNVQLSGDYDIAMLHTVVGEETRRVGMHGVREELIKRQAQSLGLPLKISYLKSAGDNSAYETLVTSFYRDCAETGISMVVFGDIFLEDLKAYRERLLHSCGLKGMFPLWQQRSDILVQEFINKRFKTIICAANSDLLTTDVLGKTMDQTLVESLPTGVDPCGENGEFHTFVYDGPNFRHPVAFELGEVVSRPYSYQQKNDDGTVTTHETGFCFQELLP